MDIVIPATVKGLEEKEKILGTDKDKDTGKVFVTTRNMGWFVLFEGSHEWLFVGYEKPVGLDPGTEIDIKLAPRRKILDGGG